MMRYRWLTPPALVLSAGAAYGEVYLTEQQAQAAFFPGEQLTRADVTLTADQAKAIERESGVHVPSRQVRAWRASNGGVFFVDRVLGKHEFITWALAVNADGSVQGLEILDYRETYGSEVGDAGWRAQFTGKRRDAPLKLDKDIKNVSGATLSCRHVTDGVKRLLVTFEVAFAR